MCENLLRVCRVQAHYTHTLLKTYAVMSLLFVRSAMGWSGNQIGQLRRLTSVPDPTTNRIIALLTVFVVVCLFVVGIYEESEKI